MLDICIIVLYKKVNEQDTNYKEGGITDDLTFYLLEIFLRLCKAFFHGFGGVA